MFICTYIDTCIHTCVRMYMHTHICTLYIICTYMHIYVRMRSCVLAAQMYHLHNLTLAMMTSQTLLMTYYHDLLLNGVNADLLTDQMCSTQLLTGQEEAIISSGHSIHGRNKMLLEYTRHMDIQAFISFCKLVQGTGLKSAHSYSLVCTYIHRTT